jgi:hypothetical protein
LEAYNFIWGIRERWAGISSIPVNSFSHVYSLNTDMPSWEDKELYKILLISLQFSQLKKCIITVCKSLIKSVFLFGIYC